MSAPRTLLILLFALVSPRLAEVPRHYVSSQLDGQGDEYSIPPFVAEESADLDREGDGIATEARAVEVSEVPVARVDAERANRIPAREPAAPPIDAPPPLASEAHPPAMAPVIEPMPAAEIAPASDGARAEPLPEASASPAVPSPPSPRTGTVAAHAETVYYEIEGLSRAEITASLRAHGPDVRGQRFFGLTEWEMSVGYRPAEVEAGCAIDDLKVHVSTETHLPRWPSNAVASPALSGAWDRFITALDHHEDGHRVLAEEAAETVRQRLLAVSAPTCDDLDGAARREMAAVMQEYEALQHAYDAETEHGRTQGAIWPPPRAEYLSASVGE